MLTPSDIIDWIQGDYMGRKYLLDCTLRDGGYLNDWEFGHDNLISIFERLTDAGVDIVEVGFLDERRPFDRNRSIFPDTKAVGDIWGSVNKRPFMVVGMIDYGTCGLKNIQPCGESFLDGIRVIFKKQKMHEAMTFCRRIKELGYKVFSQLVSITAYNEEDLSELIRLVNDVEPYAVSMVDTYGLLEPDMLLHYYEILDREVKPSVQIGFHAHNNFQMGYANAQAFLKKKTSRDVLADGTLFGMGKSAGNAPLELLARKMNKDYNTKYRIEPMLEAIEESILPIREKMSWGYNTFFYMCAANKCHPNYLSYYQKKGNLSQSCMDELLGRIEPEEKKLLYDKEFAEQLYQEYIADKFDDAAVYRKLESVFAGRELLLIGPGKNIRLQEERVIEYVTEKAPLAIAVNFLPKNIHVDYVFLTKPSRYKQMAGRLYQYPNLKIIATSNVECRSGKFDYVVMREPLLEAKEQFVDNSFLMLLKVLKRARVAKLACAGFDGYSNKEENYVVPAMEYDFVKGAAEFLNRHIRDALENEFKNMELMFVTYSHYCDVEDIYRGAD